MMAPPSSRPRLAALDPAVVATDVEVRIKDHVASLIMKTDLGAPFSITWSEPTSLGWTVRLLVGYAQRGLAATDWPDDACARDAMLDVVSALYSSAGDATFGAGAIDRLDALDDGDMDDPISVVLVAAWGRHQIAAGERVGPAELGALASITPHMVRELARRGEIRASGERTWSVTAREARRWLAARGVPGFARGAREISDRGPRGSRPRA